MKVLITGAAGYQAGFIIDRLAAAHDLTYFDRVRPTRAGRFIAGDITRYDDVRAACAGQDAVIHLVALVRDRFDKPHDLFADVMVKGTWNVAEACVANSVPKLVNISSVVCVGWPGAATQPYRVGDPAAHNAGGLYYSLAKQLGETVADAYHQAHGLRVINLRPGVISGDGLNPDPTRPTGDHAPCWFLYVHPEDVAQAVDLAVTNETVQCGSFHVVAGHPEALFDWQDTAEQLGYQPVHNWLEV